VPTVTRPSPVEPDTGTLFPTQVSMRADAHQAALARASAAGAAEADPNPLMSEADVLLALVPQLRSTTEIVDLARLRARIEVALRRYDESARKRGIGAVQVLKAQFVLATLIDHVAETMPWGAGGRWQPINSLKSAPACAAGAATAGKPGEDPRHGAIRQLARMAQDAGADNGLRELIYVALALGFEARAQPAAAGNLDADQVCARIATSLKAGAQARPLSARWRPALQHASALAGWLPLWVGSYVVAGALAALYCALALALASKSDRVYRQIAALRLPTAAVAAAAAPQPRLLPLLGATSPALQVRDELDRSVVTLRDDALFEPATANLLPAAAESLRPVAAALQRTSGQVLVVGHAGSDAERSARFPSNWELSVERARAVRNALNRFGLAQERLRDDGRADTEPLAAGGPAAAVHSGRVEIVLMAGR